MCGFNVKRGLAEKRRGGWRLSLPRSPWPARVESSNGIRYTQRDCSPSCSVAPPPPFSLIGLASCWHCLWHLSCLPPSVRCKEPVGVAGDVRIRAFPADTISERQDAVVPELWPFQGGHAALLSGLCRLRAPALPRLAPQGPQLHGAKQKVRWRVGVGGGGG